MFRFQMTIFMGLGFSWSATRLPALRTAGPACIAWGLRSWSAVCILLPAHLPTVPRLIKEQPMQDEPRLAPQPASEASTAPKYSQQIIRTREQKGHSLILHLTLGAVVLWIPAIYITVSPNHYWHA